MAPLNNTKSIDPRLLVSKGLDVSNFRSQEDPRVLAKAKAENKKKQAQKAVSTVITKGITSGTGINAPVVPSVIKTPVQQTNRSTELPKPAPTPTPTTLPNGQPIIAGNVSPQSLKGDSFSDLYSDFKKGMPATEVANLYPEYKGVDPKVLEQLSIDIKNGMPSSEIARLYPELTQQPQEDQSILDQVKQGAKDIGGGLLTSIMKTGELAARPIQYAGEQLNKGIDYVAGTKTEPFKIAGATREQLPQVSQDVTGGRPSSLGFKGGELAGDIATSSVATAATVGLAGSALGGTALATQAANIATRYPILAPLAGAFAEGAASTQAYNLQSEGKAATLGETAAGGAIGGGLKGLGMLGGGLSSWVKNLRIDEKTKTALKTAAPDDLAQYITATEKAKVNLSMPTAFEVAANKTDDAINIIKGQLNDNGSIIGSIRNTVKPVSQGVSSLVNKTDELLNKYLRAGVDDQFNLVKKGKVDILPGDEESLIKGYLQQLKNIADDPTTQDLVDLNSYINTNLPKIEKSSQPLKAVFAQVRKETDDILDGLMPAEYRPAMKKYRELLATLDEIEKVYGETGERGSTMIRNMFGSNSAKTRGIFTKIEELTGLDLYKEGQLAKFVMDSMDEKRGLEQMLGNIPTTPLGIIGKVARKGLDVVSNPITQAKKILSPQKASKTSKMLGQIRKKGSGVVASKIEDK